jgi:hypothetical protein
MRKPEAVADRWNLLGHLQSTRGKLRFGVGEMVHNVVGVFSDSSRMEAVPEYELDVEHALAFRHTVSKLSIRLRKYSDRLGTVEPGEFPGLVTKFDVLLDRLAETQAWFELRAPDKREIIRFHEQLSSLMSRGCPPVESRKAIENFVLFLEDLCSVVNQRYPLRDHDCARLADLANLLDSAEVQLASSEEEARAIVLDALTSCEPLVGRDEAFDQYVEQQKAAPHLNLAECINALREHTLRLLSVVG